MREDFGIGTLLDLHCQITDQGDGYWVKIEAWGCCGLKGHCTWDSLRADTARAL